MGPRTRTEGCDGDNTGGEEGWQRQCQVKGDSDREGGNKGQGGHGGSARKVC